MNCAAVAMIQREDGRFLCVWNKRYGGWTFPGGKVEKDETMLKALARELREETSLKMIGLPTTVYVGETCIEADPDRGRMVYVNLIERWSGTPCEMELGCPVTWLTFDEFMRWTPFKEFYAKVFAETPVVTILERLKTATSRIP